MPAPYVHTQTWDPERYARHGRFVTDLGMPVVELLAPKPGERVLDLGCGDRALTETLLALGCQVVAVEERATFLTEVRETLRPTFCDAGGQWTADYVRLRFAATKPHV